jgi:hypothetical protein
MSVRRLAFLFSSYDASPDDKAAQRIWAAFIERLRELGWTENRDLVIERRFAEGDLSPSPARADELDFSSTRAAASTASQDDRA